MTDMECKTCGSTKLKRISYHLYECEYCGNECEIAGVHSIDNSKYISFQMGVIIHDPTRILFLSPFNYNQEAYCK